MVSGADTIAPFHGFAAVGHSNATFVATQPTLYHPFKSLSTRLRHAAAGVEGYLGDGSGIAYSSLHDGTIKDAYHNGIPSVSGYSINYGFDNPVSILNDSTGIWATGPSSNTIGNIMLIGDYGPVVSTASYINEVSHAVNPFSLQRSFNTAVTSSGHVCFTCNKTFTRPSDLRRHAKKHMPDGRTFDCPIQGCRYKGQMGFYRKDKLDAHMERHTRGN